MEPQHVTAQASVQRSTLSTKHVHEVWESGFQSHSNERFYEHAFDCLLKLIEIPPGSAVLEAGCGPGGHALRLARRGYSVTALDISEVALEMARVRATAEGLDGSIEFLQGDLVDLGFRSHSFEYVFCWGVLMHVPAIERAVEEISRIVAPGGYLVVHEGNVRSPEALAILAAKRFIGDANLHRTAAGVDHWKPTAAGPLLTRRADIPWLIAAFERDGLLLQRRLPTQLTELYAKAPWGWAKNTMHVLNDWWYRHGRSDLAVGNTLIFRRQ
jgi:2-polyprenyl-3-methyl-5-hydroxy-6-metoxy-1,4-benzoquinol methylase